MSAALVPVAPSPSASPYQIVFFVFPDRVRVIAVAHQHRRPSYWRDRS
ncbi:MAG: hypothetical protein IPM79_26315 [Polyangiaceae bacterium]|nr:hypothetical protein [Polyangiaceae bacterium]